MAPPPGPPRTAGPPSSLAAPPATAISTGPASTANLVKPPGLPSPHFEHRNGRRWINTSAIHTPYPLPADARELARQALLNRLLRVLHGAHHCAPLPPDRPVRRILDLGCGSGLWCAAMSEEVNKHNREIAEREGSVPVIVEMVGMDLVPVYTDMSGVRFKFIQHNFLNYPLPFEDRSFDFVTIRDGALAATSRDVMGGILDEMGRILTPGGLYEVHTFDMGIRCVDPPSASSSAGTSSIASISTSASSTMTSTPPAAYPIGSTTTFRASANPYITVINERILTTLTNLDLPTFPVTIVPPALAMIDNATLIGSRKFALPLDEAWWENPNAHSSSGGTGPAGSAASSYTSGSHPPRKGSFQRPPQRSRAGSQAADGKSVKSAADSDVGVMTKNIGATDFNGIANLSIDTVNGKVSALDAPTGGSVLSEKAKAVRKLARLVYTGLIESLEPMIKRECGIEDEDWERWFDEAKWDWLEAGGFRGGECLEFGAWWGVKDVQGS